MKLPCEMIRDLLPLYHDGVCSQVSSVLVREHLTDCEDCRRVLKHIDSEIEVPKMEKNTARGLVSVQKAWKKSIKRACLKGVCAAVLIFAVVIGCLLALTQWSWLPVTTYGMEVAEIYRLEDGRILYRLDVPEDAWCREYKFEDHDGKNYKIPVRAIIELNEKVGWPSTLGEYQLIDAEESNTWRQNRGEPVITQWYVGHPDDAILIYEEGMHLEPAPAELEAVYGYHP